MITYIVIGIIVAIIYELCEYISMHKREKSFKEAGIPNGMPYSFQHDNLVVMFLVGLCWPVVVFCLVINILLWILEI